MTTCYSDLTSFYKIQLLLPSWPMVSVATASHITIYEGEEPLCYGVDISERNKRL